VPDGEFVEARHMKHKKGNSKSRDRLVYFHTRGLKIRS
jgi:hypothetical protein